MTPPKPPADLKARGKAFWRQILGDGVTTGFELRPDEEQILAEACRVFDRLDALRATIAKVGLVATGPKGQPIMHPAVVEERLQRIVLARLLGALNVPHAQAVAQGIEAEGIVSMKSRRARRAAQARWANRQEA